MRNKKVIFSAIDVGTTKVAAIVANLSESQSFQVLGVGVVPSMGLRKGIVTNIDEAKEAVREAVSKAEQASGIPMESAYVGITGNHISSMNTRSAIAITRGDQLVNTDDLKRVLQSARTVNVTKDRELLHVIPRDYILDGHEGIKNPVGMHGFRLDADAHVVTAAGASVRNLVKCIRSAGVEVEDVVLEPLASGGAVLRPDERANGVVLIDIGGGTTDVAIFKEGNVWHTTVLPVGGYQITRDIAIGLGVPFEMAESLKLKYGRLYPATNGVAGSPEVPTRVENGHGIMIQDVNDIIRARAEEILRLTLVELPAVDILTVAPSGVVLTGGSAKLPGMDAMCSEASRAPCRIGVPHNIHGLTDLLYDPAYATSVGLLLRGSMAEESDSKNHRPSHLRRLFFRAKRSLSRK